MNFRDIHTPVLLEPLRAELLSTRARARRRRIRGRARSESAGTRKPVFTRFPGHVSSAWTRDPQAMALRIAGERFDPSPIA